MKTKDRAHGQAHYQTRPGQSTIAPGTELFEQAVKSYEQALRTGVRLQEDTARWWTNFLNQAAWQQEWQRQVNTVMAHAIPTAQKNMEDSLRLIDQGGKTGLNLLRKAMNGARTNPGSDVQNQVQDLWNSSLSVFQSNIQAITESQAKVMESWTEFVRKGVATSTSAASAAAASAARQDH